LSGQHLCEQAEVAAHGDQVDLHVGSGEPPRPRSATAVADDLIVVFIGAKVAVDIDGCFWHRCPIHGTEPKKNSAYWRPKLDANVARDRRTDRLLHEAGWTVLRVWEHEEPHSVVARIAAAVAAGGG